LVLKDAIGHREYYKKLEARMEPLNNSSFWKIELEVKENISTCFPYKLVLDTTGSINISGRNIDIHDQLDKEKTRSLFERINSIREFVSKSDLIEETDTRRVRFRVWSSKDKYLEFDEDVAFYSFEFKKVILIFDYYVYNEKPVRMMVTN